MPRELEEAKVPTRALDPRCHHRPDLLALCARGTSFEGMALDQQCLLKHELGIWPSISALGFDWHDRWMGIGTPDARLT